MSWSGVTRIPCRGDPILQNGRLVGYVTSGGFGFRLGKRLALGYVEAESPVGASCEIEVLGERRPAQPTTLPFYDPDNTRLKS